MVISILGLLSCKGSPATDIDGPTVLGSETIEETSDNGIGGRGGKGHV